MRRVNENRHVRRDVTDTSCTVAFPCYHHVTRPGHFAGQSVRESRMESLNTYEVNTSVCDVPSSEKNRPIATKFFVLSAIAIAQLENIGVDEFSEGSLNLGESAVNQTRLFRVGLTRRHLALWLNDCPI